MNGLDNDRAWGELLQSLCDGELRPENIRQIEARLRHDPAARQEYLDYLLVHGILQWDYCPTPQAPGAGQGPVESEHAVPAAGGTPILGFLGGLISDGLTALDRGQYSLGLLLVTALASSVITAAVMGWASVRPAAPRAVVESLDPDSEREIARAPWAEPGPQPPAMEFVATLVGAADALWVDAVQLADGTRLPAGEVRLAEGLAEIVFDGGAKVVLEGPARFVPQSSRGGMLHFGRLVAHLPPGSAQFTVQTAMAVVSAQGGEFAIESAPSGSTRLHVYAGSAEVSGRTRNSTAMPHTRVAAGEALLVEAAADAELQPLAPLGERFTRDLPTHPRHFPAGLVSYWNFDEQGGPAFDLGGQNHGLPGSAKRIAGLIGKGGVSFHDQWGQQVSIDPSDDFHFTGGIALEALFISHWSGKELNYDEIVRQENGDRRIVLSFQNDTNGTHEFDGSNPAGQFPHQPVLSFGLNIGGRYSELDMPLDGLLERPSLEELTDGRVHHVVASYDAASGRKAIFVDGLLRYSRQFPPDTQIMSGGTSPLTIGNIFGGWETFNGVIDEVAIYNRALADEEVAAHWSNVKQQQSYFEVQVDPAALDSM